MKSQLKCLICKQSSEDLKDLEVHFKTHSSSERQRFPCHLCDLKFMMFSTLSKHLQLVHLKRKVSHVFLDSIEYQNLKKEAEAEFDKDSQSDVQGTELLDDSVDFQEFEFADDGGDVSKDKAKENSSDKFQEINSTPDDKSIEDNIEESPKKERRKSFKCEVEGCFKTFHHLTSFIMHGKCVHSDERSFTCEICSKSFKTRSNLNVHIKMHNNQRDHKCSMCPLSFFTSSHLKAHLKVHLKETTYACKVSGCGKKFIHSSSFKKHQNFHNGVKNHHCNICERDFSQACHLREHLKIHSNERHHMCSECGKAFRRPDTLRIHQRTHKS